MAVLSNLRRFVLLLACLASAVAGCAQQPIKPQPATDAQRADHRLVPPDGVWTLSDGARLPFRSWQPPRGEPLRAVVLALHGFNDSRDAWELPGPVFAARGIALFAPDQRGFGQAPERGNWPGSERLVSDASEMARLVGRPHPGVPIFVMGESMGGAVALCLAARPDHPPVAGFVLLAPAVWSTAQMNPLLTASLWAAATLLPDWRLTGRELPLHVLASDNIAALYRLSRDPLTVKSTRAATLRGLVELMTRAAAASSHLDGRALIAYGAQDQLVPPAATAASWARLPQSVRRAYYPHGFHLLMRDHGRAAVIGDVAAWIADPDTILPSGADTAAAAWTAGGFWEAQVPAFLPSRLDDLAGG